MAHRPRHARLVGDRRRRHRLPGSEVGLPAALHVGGRNVRRLGPPQSLLCRGRQTREWLQDLGHRRQLQTRPHPGAPFPVLPLQTGHRRARLPVRELREFLQRTAHRVLVLVVQVRPPLPFLEPQGARRRAAPQKTRNAPVAARRLGEPLPHRRPRARALRQSLSGYDVRLPSRMELQLVPATIAERVPAAIAQSVPRRAGIAHPPQEVADDVARQQPIEVLRLQVASLRAALPASAPPRPARATAPPP